MGTDSVIFVDKDRAHVNRLPIGNYLGELTNEIPVKDGHIVEYVSKTIRSGLEMVKKSAKYVVSL